MNDIDRLLEKLCRLKEGTESLIADLIDLGG